MADPAKIKAPKATQHPADKVISEAQAVSRETVSEGPQIDIALVDLFAGLRTVHAAAQVTWINSVLSTAAEECPFANKLAKRSSIIEMSYEDVKKTGQKLNKSFVADALRLGTKAILVIGGLPCKGLSHAPGKPRAFWS